MTNRLTKLDIDPAAHQRDGWVFWLVLGVVFFGGHGLLWVGAA